MRRIFGYVGRELHKAVGGGEADTKSPEHIDFEGSSRIRGELDVTIIAARNLPDMDNMGFGIGKYLDKKDVTDAFVSGYLGACQVLETTVKDNTLNPVWNEKFHIPVCHRTDNFVLWVADRDHLWAESIGEVVISLDQLNSGEVSGWFEIAKSSSNSAMLQNTDDGPRGELKLSIKFRRSQDMNKDYSIDSYFKMKSGCHVDLYSCARNSPDSVKLSDGSSYQPGSCYLDMYKTIMGAEKFIYITGWSVWTGLHLVRGDDADSLQAETEKEYWRLSLGELLKMKAENGVKVLVMVWSEIGSEKLSAANMVKHLGIGYEGMGTHDMETYEFFRGSAVECCRSYREIGAVELLDAFKNYGAQASYSHHQKTIIADCASQNTEKRSLVAFVGGLDITDGRYDSPEHPLFKSITGKHKDDFYQNSAPGVTAAHGPREPWQDIHSKLNGKVAKDVMKNFVERWTKQNKEKSNSLYQINSDEFETVENVGNWNCQLLRSITDDSVSFSKMMKLHTLTVKKSKKIDDSIARGYVMAIRSAEHFIYIENQYFLGSAYSWAQDNQTECHHTIPAEIAEKIVDKILDGESFCAYIVIPLHPEGDPSTGPIQEILAWQRRTMTMMYNRIAQALKEANNPSHPQDYLKFLCLIKKEDVKDIPDELETPPKKSKAAILRQSRRFMIYVHSKLIIVDDSIAILGSANINQRSLAGSRDTEIAVSVHQPEHEAQRDTLPAGEVAKFRLRLMEEHLGTQAQALLKPNSEACNEFVRGVCKTNWEVILKKHFFINP